MSDEHWAEHRFHVVSSLARLALTVRHEAEFDQVFMSSGGGSDAGSAIDETSGTTSGKPSNRCSLCCSPLHPSDLVPVNIGAFRER